MKFVISDKAKYVQSYHLCTKFTQMFNHPVFFKSNITYKQMNSIFSQMIQCSKKVKHINVILSKFVSVFGQGYAYSHYR